MKTINTDLFGENYLDTGRKARTPAGQPSLWEAQAKPKLDFPSGASTIIKENGKEIKKDFLEVLMNL